jgi:hypothetical protein
LDTAQSSKPRAAHFHHQPEAAAMISPQEIQVENFVFRADAKVEKLRELNSPPLQRYMSREGM